LGLLKRLIQTRARIPTNDRQRDPFVDFYKIGGGAAEVLQGSSPSASKLKAL